MDKEPIEPGSFHTGEEPQNTPEPEQTEQARAFGPEISEELKQQLLAFKTHLHPADGLIYYPCCQNDTTVSQAFPNSRVVYVDINSAAVSMLKENGFEAYEADANTYVPPKAPGIVLLKNPAINADGPAKKLKPGGYLVCNNYHNTAEELLTFKDFELRAVVDTSKGEVVFDTENLADFFTPIDSDAELKKLIPGWTSTLTYEDALDLIQELGDPGAYEKVLAAKATVIDEYRKLIEKYKDNAMPDGSGIVCIDENGLIYNIETQFPPKKGGWIVYLFLEKKNNRTSLLR